MTRILYYIPLCPFSRKVRLLLEEQKIPYKGQEEQMGNMSGDFLQMNPAGSGPIFLDNGVRLVQDYAICEHVREVYGSNFWGETLHDRSEIRRLVAWFDHKFYLEVTLNLVYEKITRRFLGQGGPDSNALRWGRIALQDHLEYIGWLTDRRRWLGGNELSLADFSAAAQLSCIDYLGDISWEKYSGAKEWYMRLKSRPSFRAFLGEFIAGIAPTAHYQSLDF